MFNCNRKAIGEASASSFCFWAGLYDRQELTDEDSNNGYHHKATGDRFQRFVREFGGLWYLLCLNDALHFFRGQTKPVFFSSLTQPSTPAFYSLSLRLPP